jgi:Holliday junction resolvase RusA-like endonuclease
MAISFFVSTIPRGQARARHAVVAGHARTYKASSQIADERTLEALLMPHKPPNTLTGAISLSIGAIMPIAASKSRKWQNRAREGQEYPTTKPDLD